VDGENVGSPSLPVYTSVYTPALSESERALHEQMTASASDHARLTELQSELECLELLRAERETLEAAWLTTSEALEG
jgi:ABC transport system ATP-binding/permease protein